MLLAVVWLIAGPPQARAQNDTKSVQFTLASVNVENLFDIYDDPYTEDETSHPKSRAGMAALGESIRQLDADFIGIQEIEREGILRRFITWYLPESTYTRTWVNRHPGRRGINVGFMSRAAVESWTVYRYKTLDVPDDDRTWTFARDLLAAHVRPDGGPTIHVLIAHFKSKRDSKNDPQSRHWRLAEARGVREIVLDFRERDPQAMYALIGDLNDTPESATITTLLEPGADGEPVLIDAHADVPADERVTYLREPYRSTIDYILVSPALAEHIVPGSAKVTDMELIGSDHAPLSVTFDLPVTDESQ